MNYGGTNLMNNIELTTMCALITQDKVLMLERTKTWRGWAFPGGHLEDGESLTECIIREMFEETGIHLKRLYYKGITNIYNTHSKKRHIVTNFLADDFDGSTKSSCDEGRLQWINIEQIQQMQMAEGMEYRLPLFFETGICELYIEWNEYQGYTKVKYQKL